MLRHPYLQAGVRLADQHLAALVQRAPSSGAEAPLPAICIFGILPLRLGKH